MSKKTAKQMAVITQFNQLQFDCTVEEIVMLELPISLSAKGKTEIAFGWDALVKVAMLKREIDSTFLCRVREATGPC